MDPQTATGSAHTQQSRQSQAYDTANVGHYGMFLSFIHGRMLDLTELYRGVRSG